MKTALVTGSTRGIGRAIADMLSANGYTVLRNGRTGGDISADLSTLEGVNTLAEGVIARTGKLDCLVLNAAATYRKPMSEMDYKHWQEIMDINVNMPFFLIQKLTEHISRGGSILFISAMLGTKPHATSIPYGVSKAAANMLAQSLVKEFAPRGVRVNAISPGFVDTESQNSKPEKLRAKIESKIALKRFATEREIADMCLSIINNTYINGAIVAIDGGYDMK
ncbi:beta-ketoacyl-ACP reductase [Clostridia bacterium]|nr:beta-ketoacyl-ACP reductase [Clostridia bacterium]